MLRVVARASLDRIDDWCALARRAGSGAQSHLVVALFHVLHRTAAEAEADVLAPHQHVTVEDFRRFLDAMLSAGYRAVSSDHLQDGTSHARPQHGSRQLLITFDDGYFNNTWALPVLEEFGVPATFFISTSHVLQQKAFWWDVAARTLRGKSRFEIDAALKRLKKASTRDIETRLLASAGSRALRPLSDLDRPFDTAELQDFARNKWVSLGNHTADHTILTHCSEQEAGLAIAEGRRQLEGLTGGQVRAIAYPNGDCSRSVVDAARREGHQLGFTCVAKANPLPLAPSAPMTIGRHLVWGGRDYAREVPRLAASFLPGARLRSALRELI